jgi:hypothetical protein
VTRERERERERKGEAFHPSPWRVAVGVNRVRGDFTRRQSALIRVNYRTVSPRLSLSLAVSQLIPETARVFVFGEKLGPVRSGR